MAWTGRPQEKNGRTREKVKYTISGSTSISSGPSGLGLLCLPCLCDSMFACDGLYYYIGTVLSESFSLEGLLVLTRSIILVFTGVGPPVF